jgi:hypothetical protein
MLPNQLGSIIRAVLPVATFIAFLTAHGFSPDAAELVVDSAISLLVALLMAAWGWWRHRPTAVVADVVELPLNTLPAATVAPLIAKVEALDRGR